MSWPFIEYTREDGGVKKAIFVNVSIIESATFNEMEQTLTIVFGANRGGATLRGEEAARAVKVIRELR